MRTLFLLMAIALIIDGIFETWTRALRFWIWAIGSKLLCFVLIFAGALWPAISLWIFVDIKTAIVTIQVNSI